MLKGIKEILKTMGEALSFANAGEMLSDDQKAAALAGNQDEPEIVSNALPPRVILAGDAQLTSEAVEHAIAVCCKKKAMLDVLYVSPEDGKADDQLAKVLPRLVAETKLDFQVTRRHGDLLAVTHAYTRARRDTLMILINVSDRLRDRADRYRHSEKWFGAAQPPAVEIIGDAIHA